MATQPDARRAATAPLPGLAVFAESCRWVADAHLAEDPEQVVAALCEIYRLLAAEGWAPPKKASILLHVHAAVVDTALTQLLRPEGADAAGGCAEGASAPRGWTPLKKPELPPRP